MVGVVAGTSLLFLGAENKMADPAQTEAVAAALRSCGEFAEQSAFEGLEHCSMASWTAAIDAVGAEMLAALPWWQECKGQGWRVGAAHRTAAPMHFVAGAAAPWYLESVFNADSSRGIWGVYLSPIASNGAKSVGTGQGGAIASLFDLATGHVASSYLRSPSPTANLHVDMLKPARSIPCAPTLPSSFSP